MCHVIFAGKRTTTTTTAGANAAVVFLKSPHDTIIIWITYNSL